MPFSSVTTDYCSMHTSESRIIRAFCRERKCAGTIGTVLVPWAGHFHAKISPYFSHKIYGIIFFQTTPGNCYGLKLPRY